MTRPLGPEELVGTAGERATIEAFVDYFRGVLPGKLRGLGDEQVRRRLVPSSTTLLGLIKHLAAVERSWFQHRMGGVARADIPANSVGDLASWEVGPDESVAEVIAEFEAACEQSRRIAAGLDLEYSVPHQRLGRVSLRWVYVHMVEEYARHAGHADIIREQLDGATGD